MPLIKCPCCNKEISSNASSCPNCGEPILSQRRSLTVKGTISAFRAPYTCFLDGKSVGVGESDFSIFIDQKPHTFSCICGFMRSNMCVIDAGTESIELSIERKMGMFSNKLILGVIKGKGVHCN